MTLARRLLVTAFVASAPVWVACSSDDPTTPVPVLITGSWTGTVVEPSGGSCSLDPTITEDNSGAVTGSASLQGGNCSTLTLPIVGTNNTGGVADSVELAFSDNGTTVFTFNGNFDGVDAMSGLITGANCTGTNCPASFTR